MAGEWVTLADDRRFGNVVMVNQRRLHFNGADAVRGDIHHVINAAEQPVVALFVAASAVARKVGAWEAAPVRLLETRGVTPDAAQHGGPRLRQREEAARAERDARPTPVHNICAHPRHGEGC